MVKGKRRSQISTTVLLLALLITPVWSFAGMMDVPFHPDESVYTYMSRYFDLYFLRRDLSSPEWDSAVIWSVTQPPVSKYVIGLALFATGHDFAALHQPWNWGLDEEANFELGNVPSTSALTVSRAMMTALFTLSIVLCAAIGYRLGGIVGGLVAGALFAISDLALLFLRRATADAPLVFFGLLAVVSCLRLVDSLSASTVRVSGRSFAWAALTGLWLSLAGGSKPSGAALIPTVLLAPLIAWFVSRQGRTSFLPERRLWALYALLLTVIVAAFVLPNPMLYENPVEGTKALIAHRMSAAYTQQREAPDAALTTVAGRVEAMVERVFHPAGLAAFLLGLGLLSWQEFRHWTRRALTERTVVLLWIGGTLAFTAFFTPLNWGRYFVSLVPCQAVVLGGLAGAMVRVVQNRGPLSRYWRSEAREGYAENEPTGTVTEASSSLLSGPLAKDASTGLRNVRGQNKVLVLIPAHNEEASLGGVLSQVRTHLPSADVLVIDDGSTDDTANVATEAAVFAISLPRNLGIGAAVQTGYILADQRGYPVVARIDADGQHNPAALPKLISSLHEESADVIVGSRFMEPGERGTSFVRKVGIRLLAGLISAITGEKVTDPTSGIQVVNAEALAFCARNYPHDYPEPESRVLLHRAGFTVKEVPVTTAPRLAGRSSIGTVDSGYYMIRVTMALLIELLRRPRLEREHHAKS